MFKSKGVYLRPKKNNLFVGSQKLFANDEQQSSDIEEPMESENIDYKLLKIELLQQELERRLARYEKNQDIIQYGLITIIGLLLIKLLMNNQKK